MKRGGCTENDECACPGEGSGEDSLLDRAPKRVENEDCRSSYIAMGDFNLVESPELDRLHNGGRIEPVAERSAVSELVVDLNLMNRWG